MPGDAGASDRPDVTVLVLAYNHEQYIDTCIGSVLAQDFAGTVEILVGEDRSTDTTRSVVERLAALHPQIRVISSASNVGMHENNRRLLRAARGRFVAYCEGDDFWHRRDKLSRQVSYLDRHPEVLGVHSDVDHLRMVDGAPRVLQSSWAHHLPHRPDLTRTEDLLVRNVIQTCSAVFRAEAICSYPDSLLARDRYAVEDWPMFLHVARQGPIGLVRESLATYRHVEGSVTNQDARAAHRRVADQFRLLRTATGPSDAERNAATQGAILTRRALVQNALAAGDRGLFEETVELARREGLGEGPALRLLRAVVSLPGVPGAARWLIRRRRARHHRRDYAPAG